jgi:hypothetical protein
MTSVDFDNDIFENKRFFKAWEIFESNEKKINEKFSCPKIHDYNIYRKNNR